MFVALLSQGSSSHRHLPMNRTFMEEITNNNHDFVYKMMHGLWMTDGLSNLSGHNNRIELIVNNRESFSTGLKSRVSFLIPMLP